MATALTNGTVGILASCSTPAKPLPFTEGAVAEGGDVSKREILRRNEMNIDRLHEILNEATCQLRKGDVIEGTDELVSAIKEGSDELPGGVAHIYAMPHEDNARPDLEKVDVEFITIGVDRAKAEAYKSELIDILNTYPNPERLAGGPSYIEVGATIGDQGAAFQLFALGKVIGLWDVITPTTLGFSGVDAEQMAGSGFIMITGFNQ